MSECPYTLDYQPTKFKSYDEYMLSEAWRLKRSQRLMIDKRQCRTCTETNNLEVHHRHYNKPLGTESIDDDLITLCHKCHEAITKRLGQHKAKTKQTKQPQQTNPQYRI